MDFASTANTDQTTNDLRARNADTQTRLAAPTGTSAPQRPEHGGALAGSRAEHQDAEADRSASDPHRPPASAAAAVVRHLGLPVATEVDIEVDLRDDEVAFLVRDRATGELLRRVPEGEARTLLEQLREFHGTLVDRAL